MIILSDRMSIHSPLPSVIHIEDADAPFVSSVKNLDETMEFKSQYVSTHEQHVQSRIHTNQAHKFPTTPFSPLMQSKPWLYALLSSLG